MKPKMTFFQAGSFLSSALKVRFCCFEVGDLFSDEVVFFLLVSTEPLFDFDETLSEIFEFD